MSSCTPFTLALQFCFLGRDHGLVVPSRQYRQFNKQVHGLWLDDCLRGEWDLLVSNTVASLS